MFANQIKDFNSNILSLRSFLDMIEPILKEEKRSVHEKVKPIIFTGIFKKVLKDKKKFDEGEEENLKNLISTNESKIYDLYHTELDIEIDNFSINDNELEFSGLHITTSNKTNIQFILDKYYKSDNHLKLLYRNTLISMLSSVEWFYSQILHYYYDKNPESAGISKKTLTLEDLKSFDSVKDAEKYLIDSKIEDLLRGNLESWFELLKSELKLKMSYLEDHKDRLIEIFQRRNLFVHNGGIINSIYLSKVHDKYNDDLKIGNEIGIRIEYLENAICIYQLSFILIAAELWKKLDPDDKERSNVLTDIIYENLLYKRWDIAEGLCIFVKQDANMDSISKLISTLNFYLCKKRKGKYDEIKNEIEKIDLTDKKEIYQLAIYSLRDEKEEFFELLPTVMDSKQLNIERLEEFPIFEEMRNTEEYLKFKEETKYFKEPNQQLLIEN